MINLMVKFKVRQEAVDDAKRVIRDFVDQIKLNEEDTLLYRSLQDSEDPCSFVHFMSFRDDYGREVHQKSSYCREFVDELYPMCEIEPVFTPLDGVAFHN